MIEFVRNTFDRQPQPCTLEKFKEIVNSKELQQSCARLLGLTQSLERGEISAQLFASRKSAVKREMPAFMFMGVCQGEQRKNDSCKWTGFVMLDYDHVDRPIKYYQDFIEGKEKQLNIIAAHITPSARGLRLVFSMKDTAIHNIAEGQEICANKIFETGLSLVPDQACKDLSRLSYAVTASYFLYLDEDVLFGPLPDYEMLPDTGLVKTQFVPPTAQGVEDSKEEIPEIIYRDVPLDTILEAYIKKIGGIPSVGNRNTELFKMALYFRQLVDYNADWLVKLLPHFGLDDKESLTAIHSAVNAPRRSLLPHWFNDMCDRCKKSEADNIVDYASLPTLPNKLPEAVDFLLQTTPDIYKPAVANGIFPALSTYLGNTSFLYPDNQDHEATLMNVLMSGSSSGKGCLTKPLGLILDTIRARDIWAIQRENEWKQANIKDNNNNVPRPKVAIIEIDPDITNAAFVQRLSFAEPKRLYAMMNEIEQFDNLKGSNGAKQQFQIMCLAFDPHNVYGQTRVSCNSISAKTCIRFNWNASTTVNKGKAYFAKVLADGPVSRINFCTIPPQPIGSPMPIYGTFDASAPKEMQRLINNMESLRGCINIPQLWQLANDLISESSNTSFNLQDEAYEVLSFRANIIAWLKACTLYAASGHWEDSFRDFAFWSLKYDMACKMMFFGDELRSAMGNPQLSKHKKSILDYVNEEFTFDNFERAVALKGLKTPAKRLLTIMIERNLIKKTKNGWKKL